MSCEHILQSGEQEAKGVEKNGDKVVGKTGDENSDGWLWDEGKHDGHSNWLMLRQWIVRREHLLIHSVLTWSKPAINITCEG